MEKGTKNIMTDEKKILEWFADYLPADIAAMALNNTKSEMLEEKVESLDAALYAAFVWATTEQGHQFWDEIANTEHRWLEAAIMLEDCPSCDGVGELPGRPADNKFPTCPACEGSGDADCL
tara:strand:+ start:213 stop:575 length:363 start_codon:yes stop_codon:yes gene_type:complete